MADEPRLRHTIRRRFGLKLRGLMVLVLLVGVVLGCVINPATRQREVVEFLRQNQWWIQYNWDWRRDIPVYNGKPKAPDWLVRRLGVDYFGHVFSICHMKATDAMMEQVGKLDQLEQLNIFGDGVTDKGVGQVGRLTLLRSLFLNRTSISDAGVAHLEGLTRLRWLGFQEDKISDAALVHLKGMSQLEYLSFHTTSIGDAGLAYLSGLTSLTEISLDNTNVSDAGLVHLKGLKNLQTLWLGGTKVTREGVRELKKSLPNLEVNGVD